MNEAQRKLRETLYKSLNIKGIGGIMAIIKNIVDEKALEMSFSVPRAMIFKNSTKCPISFAARKRFETFAGTCDEEIELYIINILENSALSKEIAARTGIRHESPQVILLQKGKPLWSKTHRDITIESLQEAVELARRGECM